MIHHLVWWSLAPEALEHSAKENADEMVKKLSALEGQIDGLLSIDVSASFLESTTEDVQVILHTTHHSAAALQFYAQHPKHLAVVDFVRAVVTGRKAIDYIA